MKYKVALRNLYISQAIIISFILFAYYFWFPHSFVKMGGFYNTAGMLILVDLVLGPLLVLLIYKENKKYLRFDINVLLAIQLVAFLFGAYSLFLKHPAYAVFSIDRFVLTNVSNIYPQITLFDQIKNHLLSKTKFVIAKLPSDNIEKNNLTFDIVLNGQPDIDSRPKYFVPLTQHNKSIFKKGIQIERLFLDEKSKKKLTYFKNKHKDNYENYAFFPLRGNSNKDMIWAFDKRTAKPVGILDIDPWKLKVAVN